MARTLTVKIDGKEWLVELGETSGATAGIGEGEKTSAELVEVEPGVYLLRQGTEQALAYVDGTPPKLTIELRHASGDPDVIAAELVSQPAATAGTAAASLAAGRQSGRPIAVRSPIPGRVVKLAVKPGDDVAAGQTTVVVEAMKMENELGAPRAGRVSAVLCTAGQAVETGQELVVID